MASQPIGVADVPFNFFIPSVFLNKTIRRYVDVMRRSAGPDVSLKDRELFRVAHEAALMERKRQLSTALTRKQSKPMVMAMIWKEMSTLFLQQLSRAFSEFQINNRPDPVTPALSNLPKHEQERGKIRTIPRNFAFGKYVERPPVEVRLQPVDLPIKCDQLWDILAKQKSLEGLERLQSEQPTGFRTMREKRKYKRERAAKLRKAMWRHKKSLERPPAKIRFQLTDFRNNFEKSRWVRWMRAWTGDGKAVVRSVPTNFRKVSRQLARQVNSRNIQQDEAKARLWDEFGSFGVLGEEGENTTAANEAPSLKHLDNEGGVEADAERQRPASRRSYEPFSETARDQELQASEELRDVVYGYMEQVTRGKKSQKSK